MHKLMIATVDVVAFWTECSFDHVLNLLKLVMKHFLHFVFGCVRIVYPSKTFKSGLSVYIFT